VWACEDSFRAVSSALLIHPTRSRLPKEMLHRRHVWPPLAPRDRGCLTYVRRCQWTSVRSDEGREHTIASLREMVASFSMLPSWNHGGRYIELSAQLSSVMLH
jgi:hypothetical protein